MDHPPIIFLRKKNSLGTCVAAVLAVLGAALQHDVTEGTSQMCCISDLHKC